MLVMQLEFKKLCDTLEKSKIFRRMKRYKYSVKLIRFLWSAVKVKGHWYFLNYIFVITEELIC